MVEREPQFQQQATLEQPAGDVRSSRRGADGTEHDRVGRVQLGQHRVRQHFAGALPAARAKIIFSGRESAGCGDRVQHLQSLGDHLGPDPIAADHRQVETHRRIVAAPIARSRSHLSRAQLPKANR
jgi:hypothetical protein